MATEQQPGCVQRTDEDTADRRAEREPRGESVLASLWRAAHREDDSDGSEL